MDFNFQKSKQCSFLASTHTWRLMPHLLQHQDTSIAIRIATLQCEYCHSKCMYVHCLFTVLPNKQRLLQNFSVFSHFMFLTKLVHSH